MSNKSIIQRLNDLENKPTLEIYQGWSLYYVVSGSPPRLAVNNILKNGVAITEPIELKVGDIITSIYGVHMYRVNGAVGPASINFEIQNFDTGAYVNIGNYSYQYIDPTQNQEPTMNSNTFVITNDVRIKFVAIHIDTPNTVIDGHGKPFMTMFIQKFNH